MSLLLTNLFASPGADPILLSPLFSTFIPFFGLDLGGSMISVLVVICALCVGAIIGISAMFFSYRKRQMWHETARIALEKGQPLPPSPLSDEEMEHQPPAGVSFAEWQEARRVQSRSHDIKGGLVLIGVGIGLILMLPGNAAGAIPGLIGVALLVYGLATRPSARSTPPSTSDRRPNS